MRTSLWLSLACLLGQAASAAPLVDGSVTCYDGKSRTVIYGGNVSCEVPVSDTTGGGATLSSSYWFEAGEFGGIASGSAGYFGTSGGVADF